MCCVCRRFVVVVVVVRRLTLLGLNCQKPCPSSTDCRLSQLASAENVPRSPSVGRGNPDPLHARCPPRFVHRLYLHNPPAHVHTVCWQDSSKAAVFDRLAGADIGKLKFRHLPPEANVAEPPSTSVRFQGFMNQQTSDAPDAVRRRVRTQSLHRNFRLPSRADRKSGGVFTAFSTAARHAAQPPVSDSFDEDAEAPVSGGGGTPHKELEEYLTAVLNVNPQRNTIASVQCSLTLSCCC